MIIGKRLAWAIPLLLWGCGQGAEQPDQTVQQLMAEKVQPTSEVYWNSVQYISDEQGEHEILPQTDADWERVRAAAVQLGEYGRLLQTEAYTQGRNEDWTRFSKALVDVSVRAEQAAASKDPDAVFEVGGTVYSVCSACHQAYPPEEGPGLAGSQA
jgi:mono/diheme cytochrome c family protein